MNKWYYNNMSKNNNCSLFDGYDSIIVRPFGTSCRLRLRKVFS